MQLLFLSLKPNVLSLSLLLPVIVSVFLAANALRPRYAPRGKVFGILMIAVALWSAAYGLELASTTYKAMIFWLRVEYLAIPYISALMLLVVLQFIGINNSFNQKQTMLLFVIPVITMILSLTFTQHTLYYIRSKF